MTADVRIRLALAPRADAEQVPIGHVGVRVTGVELCRVDGEPVLVLPSELERLVLDALGLGPGGVR